MKALNGKMGHGERAGLAWRPVLIMVGSILSSTMGQAATNDLTATLQQGLFEEEANHNYQAAIKAYEAVVANFDSNRNYAATAIFRLGEIYRKQGKTNEATAQYERVLREFSDQSALADLSREHVPQAASTAVASGGGANAPTDETARIRELIRNSPDLINAPTKDGRTLLQTAAAEGDLAVVKLLLENGAAVNGVKRGDLTPLHYAAGNGHKAIVDYLLAHGAKADAQTDGGVTPLLAAVGKGYDAVVRRLLEAGASVKQATDRDREENYAGFQFFGKGQTPLHVAVLSGYPSSIPLLIQNGAEVNVRDRLDRTPLSYAAEQQNTDAVKALLAGRADPNLGVNPPLHISALVSGNTEIPGLLLRAGADPNTNALILAPQPPRNLESMSPLYLAIVNSHPAVVRLLLEAKANPNATHQGNPLLYPALRQPESMQALLEAGADPKARMGNGWDMLQEAVAENNLDATKLLLAHGADMKAVGRQGETALHLAAQRSSKEILQLLLKHSANLNAQDNEGRTPLFYAVLAAKEDTLTALLDAGADPNVRTTKEQSPLDSARNMAGQRGGNISRIEVGARMVTLLKGHGARTDLPRFDRISVQRPSASYTAEVFSRTNDWNRFTLLELVATYYGLLAPQVQTRGVWQSERRFLSEIWRSDLPFPDLGSLTIHRPASDGKGWTNIAIDLSKILASADCSRDVWLEWGDVVEVPEADHRIAEQWFGPGDELVTNLVKCISREITVRIKGTNSVLRLEPEYKPADSFGGPMSPGPRRINVMRPCFMVRSVLDQERLIRFSSDLARIKVTRSGSGPSGTREWVLDCNSDNPPALWLRDGDIVEVPDK
jgi:cytohesin